MLYIQEALSGILGTISLVCWTSVFVPQLIQNYHQQSADGLSLTFITVWFAGDALNLIGAVWTGLVPVVIANCICYCLTDFVMFTQCSYYKSRRFAQQHTGFFKRRRSLASNLVSDEEDPCNFPSLLPPRMLQDVEDCVGRTYTTSEPVNTMIEQDKRCKTQRVCDSRMIGLVLAIVLLGTSAWIVAYTTGFWQPPSREVPHKAIIRAFGAQAMGYSSALVSLTARLPQIMKNKRQKNCAGKHFNILSSV